MHLFISSINLMRLCSLFRYWASHKYVDTEHVSKMFTDVFFFSVKTFNLVVQHPLVETTEFSNLL